MVNNSSNSRPPKTGDEPVSGVVTEALPNTLFRVKTSQDKEVLAYLSGKMRINRIRVLVGDRVELVMDAYGEKGRIVRRS